MNMEERAISYETHPIFPQKIKDVEINGEKKRLKNKEQIEWKLEKEQWQQWTFSGILGEFNMPKKFFLFLGKLKGATAQTKTTQRLLYNTSRHHKAHSIIIHDFLNFRRSRVVHS